MYSLTFTTKRQTHRSLSADLYYRHTSVYLLTFTTDIQECTCWPSLKTDIQGVFADLHYRQARVYFLTFTPNRHTDMGVFADLHYRQARVYLLTFSPNRHPKVYLLTFGPDRHPKVYLLISSQSVFADLHYKQTHNSVFADLSSFSPIGQVFKDGVKAFLEMFSGQARHSPATRETNQICQKANMCLYDMSKLHSDTIVYMVPRWAELKPRSSLSSPAFDLSTSWYCADWWNAWLFVSDSSIQWLSLDCSWYFSSSVHK